MKYHKVIEKLFSVDRVLAGYEPKIYTCKYCNAAFDIKREYWRHYMRCRPEPEKKFIPNQLKLFDE